MKEITFANLPKNIDRKENEKKEKKGRYKAFCVTHKRINCGTINTTQTSRLFMDLPLTTCVSYFVPSTKDSLNFNLFENNVPLI